MIRIDSSKCTKCGDCHIQCVKHGIMFDGKDFFHTLDCDCCGSCIKVCKAGAIVRDDGMENEKKSIDIDFFEKRRYFKTWLKRLKNFLNSSNRAAVTSYESTVTENQNALRSRTASVSRFQGRSSGTGNCLEPCMQTKSRTSTLNTRNDRCLKGGSHGPA